MAKTAILYRMVMDKHICPYGIKSKDLLERNGYKVQDHHLTTRPETDAFKEKHDVKTTPQTFINDERIGGYSELQDYFGVKKDKGRTSYVPVLSVFAVAFLMALSLVYGLTAAFPFIPLVQYFMGCSITVLALLKLRDLDAFSMQFITYDQLAMRWVRYSYIYPFAEAFVGLGILSGLLLPLVGVTAIIIGGIGAYSVFYAVYIRKRELKCACVGGDSNVPLGALSLTENIMMILMGIMALVMPGYF